MIKKATKRKARSWKDEFILTAYDLARTGLSDSKIAENLGVQFATLREWTKRYSLLALAIKKGREIVKEDSGTVTFADYVYKRLPEDLQELWDDIQECSREKNGIKRIEALFKGRGLRARQHLFIHAVTASNFNFSEACRKVGINRETFNGWKERDPDFARLVDEIHWHKGNFFENALLTRVKHGDPLAIMFANRTFNRDRGYGNKVEVNVTGSVQHVHTVDVEALPLPLETLVQIREAMRLQESRRKPLELIEVKAIEEDEG